MGGRVLLTAVNAAAAAEGLAPGLTLAEACATLPGLATVPADPGGERATRDRIVAWCGRYTPWTAADGADGALLDVTGCAHLFGGEKAMLADLCHRLEDFGFAARATMADTPGAAWALARYGDGAMTVAAPGALAAVLAPLPVAALRLDPATAAGLERLGLARIADLRSLPRQPLARRFGTTLLRRLDQAEGREREPISPVRPVAPYRERMDFADPIGLPTDIEAALARLLTRLCDRLERDGRGCRRLVLTLFRVDGTVQETAIGTARPARHPARLAHLFAERLASLDPGFGVETMTLAAPVAEPLSPAPARLGEFDPESGRAPGDTAGVAGDLVPLVDRLANRLGARNVVRLAPADSHWPERAVRVAAPGAAPGAAPTAAAGTGAWPAVPPRPLRLLRQPEPIEGAAAAGGEGSPPAAFVWRRFVHRIRLAEGPERLAPEWWRRGAGTGPVRPGLAPRSRDYWRVEDEDGRRFWIFCHGLPPTAAGEWFLHGLFV